MGEFKAVIKLINPARLKVGDYVCMVHTPEPKESREYWGLDRSRQMSSSAVERLREKYKPRLISGQLTSIETFGSKWIGRVVFASGPDGRSKHFHVEYNRGQLAMLLLRWRRAED